MTYADRVRQVYSQLFTQAWVLIDEYPKQNITGRVLIQLQG